MKYVVAIVQGDGYDELIDEEYNPHFDSVSTIPVINTMYDMSDVVEDVPMFYTEQELDAMQREAEASEAQTFATMATTVMLPEGQAPILDTVSDASTVPVQPAAVAAPASLPAYSSPPEARTS